MTKKQHTVESLAARPVPTQEATPLAPRKSASRPSVSGCKLPLVSVIPDQDYMAYATKLLQEAIDLKTQRDSAETRLKAIAAELHGINDAFGLPGCRWGKYAMYDNGFKTRQVLSRDKLVENGVDPELIAASFTESNEFLDYRFVELAE